MMLKPYLRTLPDKAAREAFASRCGTTLTYLRFVAYKAKKASAELAIAIERESGGKVRADEVRPDLSWDVIRAGGAKA